MFIVDPCSSYRSADQNFNFCHRPNFKNTLFFVSQIVLQIFFFFNNSRIFLTFFLFTINFVIFHTFSVCIYCLFCSTFGSDFFLFFCVCFQSNFKFFFHMIVTFNLLHFSLFEPFLPWPFLSISDQAQLISWQCKLELNTARSFEQSTDPATNSIMSIQHTRSTNTNTHTHTLVVALFKHKSLAKHSLSRVRIDRRSENKSVPCPMSAEQDQTAKGHTFTRTGKFLCRIRFDLIVCLFIGRRCHLPIRYGEKWLLSISMASLILSSHRFVAIGQKAG